MELDRLAGVCASNACPTVYTVRGSGGDVAVQGYVIPEPQVDGGLPHGEAVVRIPRELIIEAARELSIGG